MEESRLIMIFYLKENGEIIISIILTNYIFGLTFSEPEKKVTKTK